MSKRTICILVLTAVVIISSLSPFFDNGKVGILSADTTSGERWINPFIDKIDRKYTVPDGYIGIWDEEDLLKIGSDDVCEKTGLTWSFSAQYIQMDNIDLSEKNLNGGVKVNMRLNVSADTLTVTLSKESGDPIPDVDVWVEGVKETTNASGSASFSYDNTNACAVMCGGYVETEPLAIAYTIPANYIGDTGWREFDSDGNMDPIGFDSSSGFTGHYDGNGYRIIGAEIAIFSDTRSSTIVGIFGSLNYDSSVTGESGLIENLGTEGGYAVLIIKLNNFSNDRIGGIAGDMGVYTNIYNCYNTNDLYIMGGNIHIGGIVGSNQAEGTHSWVESCFNSGNIAAYANMYEYSSISAGGIAGWCGGILYGTYNNGNIRIVNLTSQIYGYTKENNNSLGGIVGHNLYWGNYLCQNSGELSVLVNGRFTDIGGIAGNSPSTIDCFNEGSMKVRSTRPDVIPPNSHNYPPEKITAGGLIGSGGYSRNSHNLGSIEVTYISGVNKMVSIGGIIGNISFATPSNNNTVASYFLEENITLNGNRQPDLIIGGKDPNRSYIIDHDLDPEPSEIQATGPRGPDAFRDQSTFYIGKTATGNPPEVRGYVFMGDSDNPVWGMFSGVTSGLPFLVDLMSIDISASPYDVGILMSETASFSVTAGSVWDLSYQWQVSDDLGTTWVNIPGAVSERYDFVPLTMALDGNLYRCVVYNERGALFSEAAALTLFSGSDVTISFDGNGGSGTMTDLTAPKGSAQSMPASSFTRAGWSQTSWNTSPDGSGTSYPIIGPFTMPSTDTTLYAMWQYGDLFVILATVDGNNGEISPSGAVIVQHGSDMTFTITPDGRYKVADVKVDGVSVGAVTTYTFENVSSNHTISVSFERSTFSINLWFLYVAMAVTFISAVSLWYIHKNDDEQDTDEK